MFGISFAELLVILLVVLLVFGPEKLPEIASKLGKFSSHLKKTSDTFRREFYNAVYVPTKEQTSLASQELLSVRSEVTTLDKAKPAEKEPTMKDGDSNA